MLGAFVGILPVAIGLMFYPALRGAGRRGMNFLLAMTIGLLGFLLVDTIEDALEFAGESAAIFQGPAMVVLAAAASFLLLMGIGRREGRPTGLALATYIAHRHRPAQSGRGAGHRRGLCRGRCRARHLPGPRLHAAQHHRRHRHRRTYAEGAAAAVDASSAWRCIAGGPAVIGMWIGSLAYAPQWSALALAIGAGAILQVIVEVGVYLARSRRAGRLDIAHGAGACGARGRRRLHVRDRDAGEDLSLPAV